LGRGKKKVRHGGGQKPELGGVGKEGVLRLGGGRMLWPRSTFLISESLSWLEREGNLESFGIVRWRGG